MAIYIEKIEKKLKNEWEEFHSLALISAEEEKGWGICAPTFWKNQKIECCRALNRRCVSTGQMFGPYVFGGGLWQWEGGDALQSAKLLPFREKKIEEAYRLLEELEEKGGQTALPAGWKIRRRGETVLATVPAEWFL